MKIPGLHKNAAEAQELPPLWNGRFTNFVAGTAVSVLGNNITSFLFGLLVLDMSGSTFLYAVYLATSSIMGFLGPMCFGAFLDRFSRVKTIYTLDFITAALYAALAAILAFHQMPYAVLFLICAVVGLISSVYTVTYRSLIPMIVEKENLMRSQSVISAIDTVALGMIPVATFLYSLFDMWILFTGCAILFFAAACFETRIRVDESRFSREESQLTTRQYLLDLRDGFRYVRRDKGLLALTLLFSLRLLIVGADDTVLLPFFRKNFENGEYLFFLAMCFFSAGCLAASYIGYTGRFSSKRKILLIQYLPLAFSLCEAVFLHTSFIFICIFLFFSGVLAQLDVGLTQSVQSEYVPNSFRGRFFGLSRMLDVLGMFFGQLLAGALCNKISEAFSLTAVCLITLPFFLILILIYTRNRSTLHSTLKNSETNAEQRKDVISNEK